MRAPVPPDDSEHGSTNVARGSAWIFATVLLGIALRIALIGSAENRLDCDESTVALMSLDILEEGARPMFFYGGAYNGGAALEAYLSAIVVALIGFSPIAFKLVLVLIWAAGALLFADLCRRQLPPARALGAVAFLCMGTPFFLEWSTTARGGFAETLCFSALLLWLARPPDRVLQSPLAQPIAFGLASGLSLWASEMILPLLPLVWGWLFLALPRERRVRTLVVSLGALAIGLLPLVLYNATHDWQHLAGSTAASLFQGGGAPLSPAQLIASAHFVLGWGGWLLACAGLMGAMRIGVGRRPVTLAHVLLAHACLYLLGYWLSGLRFLEIPASRVLYPLHLNLAVLLAGAFDLRATRRGLRRSISVALVAAWFAATALPVIQWAVSGEPRASGSWRASWCLIDGQSLRAALVTREIDVAFVSYWTATPLALANRVAARSDSDAARVVPSTRLPASARPGQRAALALPEGSPLLSRIEGSLRRRGIEYDRWLWGDHALLSGLDATQFGASDLGVPPLLEEGARPPAPLSPDGFN